MENRVGDKLPSAKTVTQLVQQLQDILTQLRGFGVTLTVAERRRLLRARREADPMVKRVHDLSVQYGVSIPGIPLQGMLDDQTLRERMHPITDVLRAAVAVAGDTEGEAESEMWQAYLAYYGVLSSMSGRLPELATELQPVTDFMAHTRHKKPSVPAAAPKAP